MANSVFNIPPAAPTPGIDASIKTEIQNRTAFGALKMVVGSSHAFVRKVSSKVKLSAKPGEKEQREVEVKKDETYFRTVLSIHQYRHVPMKWVAFGTDQDLRAESEKDLVEMIYAVYGGPEQMRKNSIRVLYCAETDVPVEFLSTVGGEAKTVSEIVLLSDREPNSVS